MTITGFIAYAQGWGGLYIRANKLAWKQIHKRPGLGIRIDLTFQTARSGCIGRKLLRTRSVRPMPMTTVLNGALDDPPSDQLDG